MSDKRVRIDESIPIALDENEDCEILLETPHLVLWEPTHQVSIIDHQHGRIGYVQNCRLGMWTIHVEWSNRLGHTNLLVTHSSFSEKEGVWKFKGLIKVEESSRFIAVMNRDLSSPIPVQIVDSTMKRGVVNGVFFTECGYIQGMFPFETLEVDGETTGIRVDLNFERAWGK